MIILNYQIFLKNVENDTIEIRFYKTEVFQISIFSPKVVKFF